ncbi:MAG: tetratricopeptide repeat protein [Betaproteobacteria bacterium]
MRNVEPDSNGEVVTFYSYKGGTGRSLALVNCAGLIDSCWPPAAKPILLWDFDLEAPGLHQYLVRHLADSGDIDSKPGTLELFESIAEDVGARLALPDKSDSPSRERLDDRACQQVIDAIPLDKFILETTLGHVRLIKAGCFGDDYSTRVTRFSWERLYQQAPGIFRALAARLSREYAYTFIDARTGLSDTSGVCTMLLPDVLVVVFTPNRQSLTGIEHLVRKAVGYRRESSDLRSLRVYPLPSRVELTSEDLRAIWQRGTTQHPIFGEVEGYQNLFARLFAELGLTQRKVESATSPEWIEYFDRVMVPHSPDYAYGERLCFTQQSSSDRLSLRTAFETFLLWLTTAAEPCEKPETVQLRLRMANRLTSLSPPKQAPGDDWRAWFAGIPEKILSAQREFGWAPGNLGNVAAADSAPRIALASAVGAAQKQDWGPAAAWLKEGSDFVDQGLASDWDGVLLQWLTMHADATLREKGEWLDSGWLAAAHAWIVAYEPPTAIHWEWLAALGKLLCDIGKDLEFSRRLLDDLVSQMKRKLGPEHADTVSAMNSLAETLNAMGDHAAACGLQKEVVAARSRSLGEEHAETLAAMNSLAETLYAQTDFGEARALEEKVLGARKATLGPEHPDTLVSMSNLAQMLKAQGHLAEARALQESELAICRRVLGEEHRDTLISMNNLGETLRVLGDFTGARELLESAVAIQTRVIGADHPDTLTSVNNLATALNALGDRSGARLLQEQCLAIRRRVLGEEHPGTLTTMGNLALTLKALGDLRGARALQEEVLGVQRRVLGDRHPGTLNSMNNVAATLYALGEFPEAQALHEQVLLVRREMLGIEHPDTLTSMNNLAAARYAQKDLSGARALQEKTLAGRERVLGMNHPDTITAILNLATTLADEGELGRARSLVESALSVQRDRLGPDDRATLISQLKLAQIMQRLDQVGEARELTEATLAGLRKVVEPNHPQIRASLFQLMELAQQQGDSGRIGELVKELAALESGGLQTRSG